MYLKLAWQPEQTAEERIWCKTKYISLKKLENRLNLLANFRPHTHTHTHTHARTRTHTHTHTNIYIYIYCDRPISPIRQIQPISCKYSTFSNLNEVRDSPGDLNSPKTQFASPNTWSNKTIAFKSMKIGVSVGLLLFWPQHMKWN